MSVVRESILLGKWKGQHEKSYSENPDREADSAQPTSKHYLTTDPTTIPVLEGGVKP